MKKTLKQLLTLVTVVATLMAGTLCAHAETVGVGTGDYTITIFNDTDTGISIDDDTFHAFQIFAADNVTSFSVTDDFRDFFTGTSLVSGDGSGDSYNFQQYLTIIDAYEDDYGTDTTVSAPGPTAQEVADYEIALNNYNQLAGQYMDSYENNTYAMAVQFRTYLDTYGAYNENGGTITCMVHATATTHEDGTQTAILSGLDTGYYFIFDQESTSNGIGVASTGAFIPLTTGSEYYSTVSVKQNVPTMEKTIYHDDQDKWDIVGDHQIGDDVAFRIISTLPSNIEDYIDTEANDTAIEKYDYILTDTMSAGLAYNDDVQVYTDADKQNPVDAKYLTIVPTETGFTLTVDVISYLTDYPAGDTLYTFYSATLTSDAVVASEYDQNTATLQYSSNPSDANDYGYTDSTVFHYTFALDVLKTDESGNGLAGARFGLFDVDGYAIPLRKGDTDYITGVVTYYYDLDATVADSDGGYITTETVALQDGSGSPTGETVTGKFQIYGLNDQTYYTLQEVEAPTGYNTADQFDIYFTVTYNELGTEITHFTDGSAYVYTSQDAITGNWSSTSTIINRLKIYLPTTGGVGTVLFQVGGGALMLGAAAMVIIGQRKKEKK